MPNAPRRTVPVLVIVLAACGGPGAPTASLSSSGGTSAAPQATTAPSATPSSTPAPSATTAAAPYPPEGCNWPHKIEPASPEVDAEADLGHFGINLQMTEVTDPDRLGVPFVPPARDLHNDGVGLLIGGREFATHPSASYLTYLPPITITAATATLTMEGGTPRDLPVRFVPGNENFNRAAFSVPDVDGRGVIEITLEWRERCYAFTATGRHAVQVVSTRTTAGCAMDDAAFGDQLDDLLDDGLTVGSGTANVFSPIFQARYLPRESIGIDASLLYGFDPDDASIAAAPGSRLRVEVVNPDLHLSDLHEWIWTRRSVAAAVKDYPPGDLDQVLEASPPQRSDGSFRLDVPEKPGRYVAGLEFTFESACVTGTLWAVVPVTVE